jgi:hypothetical protein
MGQGMAAMVEAPKGEVNLQRASESVVDGRGKAEFGVSWIR